MEIKYTISKLDVVSMMYLIQTIDKIMEKHLSSQLKQDLVDELFKCCGNVESNLYKTISSMSKSTLKTDNIILKDN